VPVANMQSVVKSLGSTIANQQSNMNLLSL